MLVNTQLYKAVTNLGISHIIPLRRFFFSHYNHKARCSLLYQFQSAEIEMLGDYSASMNIKKDLNLI